MTEIIENVYASLSFVNNDIVAYVIMSIKNLLYRISNFNKFTTICRIYSVNKY